MTIQICQIIYNLYLKSIFEKSIVLLLEKSIELIKSVEDFENFKLAFLQVVSEYLDPKIKYH